MPEHETGFDDSPIVTLTAEQAQVLLQADLANLAKKVSDKKTLSASERNLLHSVLSGGKKSSATFARNKTELAEILGVSRKTITRKSKLPGRPAPEANGNLNVAAWRLFIGHEDIDEDDEDDVLVQSKLKARQILLQNEKLEFQLAVLKKQYVLVSDVEGWGGELGTSIRQVVSQLHRRASSIVGLSVGDAEQLLKRIEDEILSKLHALDARLQEAKDESAA